jgi:adenosylcobinamide-GDP ribazoletransferase
MAEGNHKKQVSNVWVAPFAALQFLTLVPPIIHRRFTVQEMGWSVGFFPLVGVLLGLVLAGLRWGSGYLLPPGVSAVLVLTAWVLMTGALHLDGFLDACDGLLGGHAPEARLEIMHDERVGAFGVIGGVLLLLLKYSALVTLEPIARLILVPTLGRWGMVWAVIGFPYARASGAGRVFKDYAGWRQMALATAVVLPTAWIVAGGVGLVGIVLTGILVFALARFALVRLPGLTGDVYGAICEIVEAVVLLLCVIWP